MRVLVMARRGASAAGNQQVLEDINVLVDSLKQQRGSARGTTIGQGRSIEVELLTVPQAAERSGRTPRAIRKACEEQRLQAEKAGRDWVIRSDDLDDYRYGGTDANRDEAAG
ncbi:helix-turn-helix domain-containing protein [Agromyces sp. NPDC058104]|uniref:helix-turn-helix domain-containing protein n=1 Tax=Agromyces sp. NPDC058104 TaxID=3346342 RepID=UPI0036DF2C28